MPLAAYGSFVLGEMRSACTYSLAKGSLGEAASLVLAGGRPGCVKPSPAKSTAPSSSAKRVGGQNFTHRTTRWGTGTSRTTKALAVKPASLVKRTGAQVYPRAPLVVPQ
jgi:hypothetical protein